MSTAAFTNEQVLEQLRRVRYPGFSRDIVSFGIIKNVEVAGGDVTVFVSLATNQAAVPQQIKAEAEAALRALPGIGRIDLRFDIQNPLTNATTGAGPNRIDGVKHIVAVASGKGGVGKSTVAANLAVALRRTGAAVGLCDCDLYGPSMGMMFGTREAATATEDERINPVEAHGIKLMSMAFLLSSDDSPAILRGPMVTKYTQQFLRRVAWGELDYLILDLPPGTGDIQLTIVQTVALSGALIVTTPQEVALIDARKAVNMFVKTNVPVLGIVENMSYFIVARRRRSATTSSARAAAGARRRGSGCRCWEKCPSTSPRASPATGDGPWHGGGTGRHSGAGFRRNRRASESHAASVICIRSARISRSDTLGRVCFAGRFVAFCKVT